MLPILPKNASEKTKREYLFQKMEATPPPVHEKGKKILSPELLAKMKAGREKYWEKQRKIDELTPEVDKLSKTIYAMAKDQKDDDEELVPTKFKDPAQARNDILRKIFKKKDKLIEAQIAAAIGIRYTAVDGKHVYTKLPNTAVGEYLLNQLIGKPTESLEVKQVTKILVDL